MALIVSTTAGGADLAGAKVDFGNVVPGASATKDLYIRNTYTNKVTDVRLYFAKLSGTYDGAADADTDWSELVAWGNAATTDGLFLNQNASSPSWTQLKDGSLDSDANSETLSTDSGVATAGEIAGGGAEEAHIQEKFAVPADEDTGGSRQWDLVIAYSYTS